MNSDPLRQITDSEVRAYHEQGAIVLRGLFDAEWIDRMRAAVERILTHPSAMALEYTKPNQPGRFLGDMFMWAHDRDFRAFVFESPAPRIAKRLMGSAKVNLFYDQLFVKEPGTEERTPWHQDLPYWAVSGKQICSVWITLDAVTVESSGLEYIRGSHAWNRWFKPKSFTADDRYAAAKGEEIWDFDARRSEFDFLSWQMQAGDVLVHHPLTVHGAAGNRSSTRRRRAFATRWTGDDARYDPRPGTFTLLRDPGIAAGAAMDCELFPVVIRS